MLVFIDETGKHHSAIAEVKETKGVNGEKSISGTIFTNDEILEGIGRGWRARFNGENYYLTYAYPVDEGQRIEVEFDAVHEFFFDMKKSIVHDQLENGSHTFKAYLDFIFKGSGYDYALEVSVAAFEKQSFGFKNRLTLFNDIVNSTGVEFSINGRIVRILNEVGTDLSTIVKKGFNMNELKIEKDIGSFITLKKGYGAYLDEEDHSKGRLTVEYISPLADIYGRLEGEPVIDERYTVSDNLLARLKEEVESSYGISVTLDMEDLAQAGYEYEKPHEGDYIMAINEDLKFSQKIRIKSYTTQYDTGGTVLDHEVSCGSDNLIKKMNSSETAYKKDVQSSIDAARNAAESAWRSADNKNAIYHGSEEPQGDFKPGDTWYQVDGEQVLMKYWNGYEWVLFFDPDANYKKIDEAFSEAESAKEEAKNAYKNAVKDAESKVNEASSEWESKLETVKEDFSTGLAGANSVASNAQQKAETAHQEAVDAANQADTNSTNITQLKDQITSIVTDVSGNSSSIVQLGNQISSLVQDVSGHSSMISQLSDNISLKVSADELISSINLSPETIRISGRKIQLDGDVLINQAWVDKLYVDAGFISKLEANSIRAISADITSIITQNLAANTITSSMIKADTTLVDKIFANSALINQLTSKNAFVENIQAIELNANNINSGTLNAANVNIINMNVDKLVGNISSFVQSYWNTISNTMSMNGDGLVSSRSDGSISAKYLADGLQIWGGGRWAGSLSWASGPAIVLWAKRSHSLRLGYQGSSVDENLYITSLEIDGTTGIIKTFSDINMNNKALLGTKYFDGITYFNGTGDITVLGTKRFGNNYFTRSGGSRVMELVDTIFTGGATGVGWQSFNGAAGIMFASDGNVLVKRNWSNWTVL